MLTGPVIDMGDGDRDGLCDILTHWDGETYGMGGDLARFLSLTHGLGYSAAGWR